MAEALNRWMKSSGVRARVLARLSGVDEATISHLRRGRRASKLSTVLRICAATAWEVQPHDFLSEQEQAEIDLIEESVESGNGGKSRG